MKATLLVRGGLTDKQEYPLVEGKSYLIGRSRDADVIVKDKLASRNHCKLAAAGGGEWAVSDLGSSNGTFVNRQRVTTRTLKNGDSIQVGKAIMEFRLLSATTAPTEMTGEPGREAGQAPQEAIIRPAGLRPTARLEPTPPPPPAQAPKPKETVDEDIRGLFEFLDKVGKGGKAVEEEKVPGLGASQPARPRLDEETPPAGKRGEGEEQLFSLLDDRAEAKPLSGKPKSHPPPPLPPSPPPQPPAAEQGGLLAFLRKKKQQP